MCLVSLCPLNSSCILNTHLAATTLACLGMGVTACTERGSGLKREELVSPYLNLKRGGRCRCCHCCCCAQNRKEGEGVGAIAAMELRRGWRWWCCWCMLTKGGRCCCCACAQKEWVGVLAVPAFVANHLLLFPPPSSFTLVYTAS